MSETFAFGGGTVTIPTPKGDARTWGALLNAALQQIGTGVVTLAGTVLQAILHPISLTGTATEAPLRLIPQTPAPTSPLAGEMYYNSVDNTLYYYNGTIWVALV